MTNSIHIGSMAGGAIQQGSPDATQTVQITIGNIATPLAEIESFIAASNVKNEALASDLEKLKAELAKPAPSASLVRELGASIRSVVENLIASAVISPQAITALSSFARAIGLG